MDKRVSDGGTEGIIARVATIFGRDSRQVGSSSDEVGPGGGALVTFERDGYSCWFSDVAMRNGTEEAEEARLPTGREDEAAAAADATARLTIWRAIVPAAVPIVILLLSRGLRNEGALIGEREENGFASGGGNRTAMIDIVEGFDSTVYVLKRL